MLLAALTFPNIDPVLIHLGPLAIRWYSLSYIAMLLLGWWLIARMLAKKALWTNPPFKGKAPATADDIGDLVVWVTLGVILGGRIGWVIFYGTILCSVTPDATGMCHGLPGEFLTNPIRIIAAWDGGMSFHGGLIGVVVSLLWFARRHKLDPFKIGDLLAVAAPIGMFLVRIANFINGELWGRPTDVPWAMVFCNEQILRTYNGICPAGMEPRHPSQLYEAGLEGILLFIIMQVCLRVLRMHEKPGLLTAVMFLCYGTFRIIVEFFREPDAPFLGPVTMGQTLSFLMWAAAAFFFWYALIRKPAPTKRTT